MLPLERVRDASQKKFAETDPLFLQYGYISGYPAFRQCLAKFLEKGYGKRECRGRAVAHAGVSFPRPGRASHHTPAAPPLPYPALQPWTPSCSS